jgi:ubiquinone/menaquinone biosynthesis C-methylase UbiE
MIQNTQKEAFINYEADSWFERNQEQLLSIKASNDPVLKILRDYNIQPKNCLEIGASVGFRLNGIQKTFPSCQAVGIEPSQKAIKKGREVHQNIQLIAGTADDLSILPDQSFDLIIAGFFMYVVDRSLLLKAIAEIDRVLKEGGKLILIDFYALKPTANNYHHIKDQASFSFKQNYEDIFLASGLYHLMHKESIRHDTYLDNNKKDASVDFKNKASITALIKDTKAIYE